MSKATAPEIDRSEWGKGPWDGEPDRWEGEFDGFPALAVRANHGGNWCGYVAVPPGHPWHGKDGMNGEMPGTEDGYVEVHGGVTYSGSCSGRICHVPKPGEPDDVWWLGFDCHHGGDSAPGDAAYWRRNGYTGGAWDSQDQYRSLSYVQNNCRRLAAQALAAAATQESEPAIPTPTTGGGEQAPKTGEGG